MTPVTRGDTIETIRLEPRINTEIYERHSLGKSNLPTQTSTYYTASSYIQFEWSCSCVFDINIAGSSRVAKQT